MADNAEQEKFWNGATGTGWVDVEDYIDSMLTPLSDAAIARVNASEGERIIDVGCGCGTTTIQLTANGASAWGVDISTPMIERAKQKAAGNDSVSFSVGDAAAEAYTPDHQAVFSRFGVMFFSDPVAAFANIRTALAPGGRLVYLCWQAPTRNPWIGIAGAAVQSFLPDEPPPDPTAPGPFSMADPDRTASILEDAGFKDVKIEPLEKELRLGDDLDTLMSFQARVGPLARVKEVAPEKLAEAEQAVRDAFSPMLGDRGIVMSAAAWLVTAGV